MTDAQASPKASGPPLLGMRHIALFVSDDRFDATVRFYREAMGLTVDWQPDPDNVYLTSGKDNVAIHRATKPIDHERSPLDHLGFLVPTAEVVAQWHERLAARTSELGFEIVKPVKLHRDGATSFYFDDPAGHRVQIIHIPSIAD
jgi:catechol 2,3-dioxygenase-like lactoylglutathione lyase family enzyme